MCERETKEEELKELNFGKEKSGWEPKSSDQMPKRKDPMGFHKEESGNNGSHWFSFEVENLLNSHIFYSLFFFYPIWESKEYENFEAFLPPTHSKRMKRALSNHNYVEQTTFYALLYMYAPFGCLFWATFGRWVMGKKSCQARYICLK